jgi:ABC-type Zn uptake system ZnuABC Zn-binding protein ZnuA
MVGIARGLAAVLCLLVLAVGCSSPAGEAGAPADDGRLKIATTVAPITSIVSSIVGDLADVTGIVPEGTNSHTFEPSPDIAELLSTADLIFINGLMLEEPTKKLAETNKRDSAEIVELGNRTVTEAEYLYDFSFPRSGGKPNPHLWTDPTKVRRYAEIIRDEVADADPDNAAAYSENLAKFQADLTQLDKAMYGSFVSIPRADRKLLTYHDAYAYFAQTYDWTVIGAIQVSDFEDPTPKELAGIIDQVRNEKVKAIFGSEVFPSPVLEQIGKETGARYVDVLRDDDLPGEPGDPEHSYIGLMRFDYKTIVESLGGNALPLNELEVTSDVPDEAEYPQ